MAEEFKYSFTEEEHYGLLARLDLLLKYFDQDLTLDEYKKGVLIETTKDLREKIENDYEK